MKTYRNFIIEPEFNYNNGTFDGKYYHKEADEAKMIIGQTLTEVKREIDDYIFEGIQYRIHRRTPKSNTITKFFYLEDAIAFCEHIGESISNIRVFNRGEEVAFDAI